jgi:hypothetical protein
MNSASFFVSAMFIAGMRVPPIAGRTQHSGWHGLVEGLRYMRSHRSVGWDGNRQGRMGGGRRGVAVAHGLRRSRVSDRRQRGDAGIGILYAARGLGAGAGSFIVMALSAAATTPR